MRATINSVWWAELDRGFIPEKTVQECMIEDNPRMAALITKFFREGMPRLVASFPYAETWLKKWKEKGYGIYLLSNYPESFFTCHWEQRFSFTRWVDDKVISYEVQKLKPDPSIYDCLIQKTGMLPQEAVFLDDHKENVAAAVLKGFYGIHFTDYEKAEKQLSNMLDKQADDDGMW